MSAYAFGRLARQHRIELRFLLRDGASIGELLLVLLCRCSGMSAADAAECLHFTQKRANDLLASATKRLSAKAEHVSLKPTAEFADRVRDIPKYGKITRKHYEQ